MTNQHSLIPTRRDFLRLGVLNAALSASTRGEHIHFGRVKRCVLLFLTGGPPQHDTFDMKPDAPREIRGELKPIATTVPGLRFSELCPSLAKQAHRVCVLRSLTHTDGTHTSAGYTMLTGVRHPLANTNNIKLVRSSINDHPHFASLVSWARPAKNGLPAIASLPEEIKDDAVNEYPGLGPGFLGSAHGAFLISGAADKSGFRIPDLSPPDVTRMNDRRHLLSRLDRSPADDRTGLYSRAYDILRSPAVYRALQVEREPGRVRETYGSHLFGQGCLLARRLLEAGVPLVNVYWHYEGPQDSPVWDTHANNYPHLRQRLLPPADRAIGALLEDLDVRGLLDDTLVLCWGEFGRTPKVNKDGGRDHWPHAQSVLVAGAGVKAGHVHGATDRQGAYPSEAPVTPADLIATVLHLMGVRPDVEVIDRIGRPLAACAGKVATGLLA